MGQESKYLGIGTKIIVMVAALVVTTSCAVGYFTYLRFKQALVAEALGELSTLSRVASTRFLAGVSNVRADAHFLAGVPEVQGIVRARLAGGVDPVEGWSEARMLAQLAVVFESMLSAKPDYVQARLIGVADGGRELLRVDRSGNGGSIRVVPNDELQQKANSTYFQQAVKLPADKAYLSDIEFNREVDNQLNTPYQPVLRAATPIYTPQGDIFGIVIINRNLAPLFAELRRNTQLEQSLYITNDQGDFLLHPDANKTFGFELGQRHQLQDEFPQLQRVVFDPNESLKPVVEPTPAKGRLAFGWNRVNFDPEKPGRFIAIALAVPFDAIAAEPIRVRNMSILVAAGVLVPALAVAFALSRTLANPLKQIAAAAKAFGREETEIQLPINASDETGVVARALDDMIRQVRSRTEALESEVAERERAEQRLSEANHELARRAASIERFNKQLARSNDELKQFAYVASHDLQEPLRKVTSFCEMLRDEYRDGLDAQAQSYIDYAVSGALRMKALVSDLLDYSRVETQGKPLAPTPAESALTEAIDNLEMTMADAGATVERSPLPTVAADRAQLVRLFQNLIGNAIKYRGDAPPRVEVWAELQDDEWVFHVQDNGIGIDAQYHGRIFVIFQRLHSREAYSGTGIGLAVCKRIVERFGGRIWVESTLGNGSDFCFALPKVDAALTDTPTEGQKNDLRSDELVLQAD
jgi:signal transduction histidine kinase